MKILISVRNLVWGPLAGGNKESIAYAGLTGQIVRTANIRAWILSYLAKVLKALAYNTC